MNREAVAQELVKVARSLMAAGRQKYKGYTIEKSGDNFYVTDPSGHRAFGEVPASIETAKKWIDMDIREKGTKRSGRVQVAKLLKADSGDVPVFFNVYDLFKPVTGKSWTSEQQREAADIVQNAAMANWVQFEKAVKETLKQDHFARTIAKLGIELR